MTFILKVMHGYDQTPVPADNEYSLYADITAISFIRQEQGFATAHVSMREPVKTADVPGFCEVEKHIDVCATAYVMNENGKTVASFTAHTSGHPEGPNRSAPCGSAT